MLTFSRPRTPPPRRKLDGFDVVAIREGAAIKLLTRWTRPEPMSDLISRRLETRRISQPAQNAPDAHRRPDLGQDLSQACPETCTQLEVR